MSPKADAIQKAYEDMIIYGTGAIIVHEDKVDYVSHGDIHLTAKEVENEDKS